SWFLAAAPTGDSGYAFVDKPQVVDVKGGQATTASPLRVVLTDATIEGKVVDASGNVLTTRGVASAVGSGQDGTRGLVQGPIVEGRFTLKVPHGNYKVVASFLPGAGYGGTASADADVSTAGATAQVSMTVASADATIAGQFKLNGAALTGQAGSVFGAT